MCRRGFRQIIQRSLQTYSDHLLVKKYRQPVASEPLRFSGVLNLMNVGQPVTISWSGSDGSFANLIICKGQYDADSHTSNFVPLKTLESNATQTLGENGLPSRY